MSSSVTTQRTADARLVVKVQGVLDASLGDRLCQEIGRCFAEGPLRGVVVDMRWLRAHDDACQGALRRAHAFVQRAGLRSAYLTVHPRVRALVLWLCQETQDPGMRPVPSDVMAEAWLAQPDQIRFADQAYAQAEQLLARAGKDRGA